MHRLVKPFVIFVFILSFWIAGNYAAWFFQNVLDAIGFVLFGVGILLSTFIWKGKRAIASWPGIILWSASAWIMGYLLGEHNGNEWSKLPAYTYQLNVFIWASMPLILIGIGRFLYFIYVESGIWKDEK